MSSKLIGTVLACAAACSLGVAVCGRTVAAEDASKPAAAPASAAPEMQLPPGWSMEDMQACAVAGTPGPQHAELMLQVGTWTGTNTMWMFPGAPAMTSPVTQVMTSAFDGRYIKCEVTGEIPGMGAFVGMGMTGYDNVSGKYVGMWVDNHSTTIMHGTGERSADGKVYTLNYNFHCPITKKPAVMREVQTFASPSSMTVEFFGTDPKSGKEFKCMEMVLTKAK